MRCHGLAPWYFTIAAIETSKTGILDATAQGRGIQAALPHQKSESLLDRVSTGSGSDLVQPLESKILSKYCMPSTDQVATAPCTDPIQQ